jgi:hypothetical protein
MAEQTSKQGYAQQKKLIEGQTSCQLGLQSSIQIRNCEENLL